MRTEKARSADAAAIAALEAACFSDPWPEDFILRRLDNFLVARPENGEPGFSDSTAAGYVCLSHVLDEGSIDNIAVVPELRRRGLADALLDAAENEARALSLTFITLEVRASNIPAIALYEKHGFTRVGLRRGYYEKPREDALLMTKFL